MDTNDDESALLTLTVEVYRRVAKAATAFFTEKDASVVVGVPPVTVGVPPLIADSEAHKRRMQRQLKHFTLLAKKVGSSI
jgi:hypothetical protein